MNGLWERGCLVFLAGLISLCGCTKGDQATDATEAAAWKMPVPALGYAGREGRALFDYYCAPCHGASGRGDGFNAYNLDPRPRDLADSTFQAERSDADLASVITLGGGAAGLSSTMPPWGKTLADRQVRRLVGYIRELARRREAAGHNPP